LRKANEIMKLIAINGRFLGKPITGTSRFAREIVWALDALLEREKNAALRVELVVPRGTPAPEGLKRIGFRTCGSHQGHVWEQWDLWRATRKGLLLSLTNSGPVLHPNHLVVVHDALVYKFPHNFTLSYRVFHQTLGRLLARRARIATVSAFSQSELARLWRLDPASLLIVPNGHEHILRVEPDDSVLAKLGLEGRRFFLFVGSPSPNKNLERAIEAFSAIGREDVSFVLVGAAKADVFQTSQRPLSVRVLRPGRLSDGEIVSLYKHAVALVFPSLYEGFGVPPLEAMVHGCPVIAADIPPVREVCADAALYFNPRENESLSDKMTDLLDTSALRLSLAEKGFARYKAFRWEEGAKRLCDFLF
jgi:glycosyltransferase involved in cell wall biosynthesis